jgi:hypothetical protein
LKGEKMFLKTKKKIWISIILPFVFAAGCSRQMETGILKDYQRLKRADETMLLYKPTGEPLSGYTSIIVEPVVAEFTSGRMSESTIEDLRRYVELSIKKVVLSGFDLADSPGENVAVLKARLSSIRSDSPVAANEQADGFSGPSIEIRICDSNTDKTLLALVLARPQISSEGLSRWTRAKIAIEHWASRLAVALYCEDNTICPAAAKIPDLSKEFIELQE